MDNWKTNSAETVRMRHGSWSAECDAWRNALEMHMGPMEVTQQSYENLLSSVGVGFLQVIQS